MARSDGPRLSERSLRLIVLIVGGAILPVMAAAGTVREARLARLLSQALLPGRVGPRDVHGVVRRMVAIQAQHPPAAPLAIRARCARVDADDVAAAVQDGTVVKTWALRGTLHLLARDDVAWIVRLVGPDQIRKGRRRLGKLGLDEDAEDRAAKVITKALDSGPLSRAALRDRLRRARFDVDKDGQAGFHLIQRTGLRGLICFAPGERDSFALAGDVVPTKDGPTGEAAVAELAKRYLAGYAPATAADFIAWSGLPAKDVRSAWPSPGNVSSPNVDGPVVTLLPHFDNYLLGYADRSLVLDEAKAKRVHGGGGWLRPIVLIDGRVAGTWSTDSRTKNVELELFGEVDSPVSAALRDETASVERFLQA